jgi:fibronectin type 3 domain-containing protein
LAFETDDSAFYLETGNGPGGHGNPTLNAAGFPSDASYYDAAIKIVADPTTTATNQNPNGWGMKVADYFIPYNQVALDNADRDFGSAGPILLPPSAGIPGHPNLLIAAGKEGKIYVIDRDNMGHFSPTNDNVLNAVANGSGNNTPPVALDGEFNTGAYYNGTLYWTPGYDSNAGAFELNSNGTLTETSQTSAVMGTLPGSIMVTANGTTNGIVWIMDRNANEIHAYNANSLSTELWNSGDKPGDSLGAVVKFAVPTIVNGEVYVGTTNSLVVYGLTPPSTSVPVAPVLSAAAVSGTAVNLSWTDSTLVPNTAAGYLVEDSTDGTHFTQITTAPGGSTAISIGGLSALTKYYFRIRGYNALGDSNYSNIVNATTSNSVAAINFSSGFASAAGALALNGSAALSGSNLVLTNGGKGEAGSAFFNSLVDVSKFTTQFNFQLSAGTSIADGMTFTIQGTGPTALGANGGGLGYGINPNGTGSSIGKSVAIKFDVYSNSGEGTDSTGLFTNGATPTTAGSINLTSTGVNLQSGDPFQVNMSYDGTTLTVIILDTKTGKSATQTYTVNIPSFTGSSMAYVGFTGGTGGLTSTQSILSWTFSPNAAQAPNAPTGLGATPATATSVSLSWMNTAGNQTGYHLDRATDVNFTQNLITETLPASPSSFTDTVTGLGPGQTYYYRLRAFNTAGDSGNSNTATVTIPLAPPTPTGAIVTNVTTSEIDLSWTDNAGPAATGYLIMRGASGGTLVPYANLPAEGDAPPIQYTWSDKNVTPGTAYEYHIEAINTSGNNDFTGTNADTLTLPPSNVVAMPGNGSMTLTWTAPTDAVEYNIYRGTSPGGESTTPYATVTTGTTFTDSSVTNGTKYYYTVTALNPNINHVPVIPAESAASTEVSATPGTVAPPPPGFSGFSSLKLNGSAQLSGTALELTNGSASQAASAFTSSTFSVAKFTTSFDFQLTSATADGFTFTLQGVGPMALGMNGGGLGYSTDGSHTGPTITKSVAIKFDLAFNQGEGSDSTGLYLNGASPTNVGSIDLTNTGINLHSGDAFNVYLSYDGTALTEIITDDATKAVFTHSYTVNIPAAVGGTLGYVGFTAGTGKLTAVQKILDWTYTPVT